MEAAFAELISAVDRVMKQCPWTSGQSVESYAKQIRAEADEVLEAVAKEDNRNLREELGDLFWDVIVLAKIAEKENRFEAVGIMSCVVEKMKRRKPYIFENRAVSLEEAQRIWYAAKKDEKNE